MIVLRTIFWKIKEEAQTGIPRKYHIVKDSWKGRIESSWIIFEGIKIEGVDENIIIMNNFGRCNPKSG